MSMFELMHLSFSFSLQVGDVVLVHDETVMDNDFKMGGLETLVHFVVYKRKSLLLGMIAPGFLDRKMLWMFACVFLG